MPRRKIPLVTGEVYHVFNKSMDGKKVLSSEADLERALVNLWYYRFESPPVPVSRYFTLGRKAKIDYHNRLIDAAKLIEVFAYCLMPTHFHFLVRQLVDGGVSKYLANFQNSYTRYFNTKSERKGVLFLTQFKAVRIESDEQLLHVSRYIHLNPLTNGVVKSEGELEGYNWSSWKEYLGEDRRIYQVCETSEVLNHFGDPDEYVDFVYDQASYQKELAGNRRSL